MFVALKILRASDLTLFKSQLKNFATNQKAINLNRTVFVDQFYPGLANVDHQRLEVSLDLRGPGGLGTATHARNATIIKSHKNWRLDGRMIEEPPEGPRYDSLVEGDLAIIGFEGSPAPTRVTVVLVSQVQEFGLWGALKNACASSGQASMKALGAVELAELAGVPGGENLSAFLPAGTVEDALYGPTASQVGDGRGAAIAPETVLAQAGSASDTGRLGEEIFADWLATTGHPSSEFEWVAATHARASFDFLVDGPRWEGNSGGPTHVDVKTTRGDASAKVHMSIAEVRFAAERPGYRIARVSSLTQESARIAILAGVSSACQAIRDALDGALPDGVGVDSVNLAPVALDIEFDCEFRWQMEDE